ncbi:MAG: hypothetical protein PHG06_00240 [Parabacteroides sp.]|nr:hypothetical protein [Parabacteroides sp.]
MTTEIAQTILGQMGGIRSITLLTSAKDFLDHGNGVSFKFKGSKTVNYVKVVLNAMDTYDVEFGKISMKKAEFGVKMPEYNKVKEFDDIYNDQLKGTFEQFTGLYLSLF